MDEEAVRTAIADLTAAIAKCDEASQIAARAKTRLESLLKKREFSRPEPVLLPPSTFQPAAAVVKFYWDVDDEGLAPLAKMALEAAFRGYEILRWTPTTPPLGADSMLFGFVGIFGRADIGQERLTEKWSLTNRSVVVVLRGPGAGKAPSKWERPTSWEGLKEQWIHFYARFNGHRFLPIEGNFLVTFGFGIPLSAYEWEPQSLQHVVEKMKEIWKKAPIAAQLPVE